MVQEGPSGAVDKLLCEREASLLFLTPAECRGGWRGLFGEAAARVPEPPPLFAADEVATVALGFPVTVSAGWETLAREIARLVRAETAYRTSLVLEEPVTKGSLLDLRAGLTGMLSGLIENALLHNHGRRLPELLWLALSREIAEAVQASSATLAERGTLPNRTVDEVRYAVAQRLADVAHRAEAEAMVSVERWGAGEPASHAFGRLLRSDLLPLAEVRISRDFHEIDGFIQSVMRVDPARVRRALDAAAAQVDALRARSSAFDRVLVLLDAEAPTHSSERLLLSPRLLDVVAAWEEADRPLLPPDLVSLLRELSSRLKRFEVIAALRERLLPVTTSGGQPETVLGKVPVRLSAFTRPLDFTAPGIVDSTVRRFGLVYDLVEFTQILEGLRRRGRQAEEQGMRFMLRFQSEVEAIRARYRLKFEKFLGDGAFYSSRSARAMLLAAAELRGLYEQQRAAGFPFDKGMRLALSVGSYHLLPMSTGGRPHFEFFGHGLVELARLTSGKTTQEVEDIADFLIAAGYDVHRVLEFLEPVRHASRYPEHARERPYAAFLAGNRELVNLGGVVTEAFLRDLETEWQGRMGRVDRWGLRWLVLVPPAAEGSWIGLRFLGTARLKGLDPTPVAETVVFDGEPEGMVLLTAGTQLVRALAGLAGALDADAEPIGPEAEVDAALTVVSVEDQGERAWYIGLWEEREDLLHRAFCVRLNPVDMKDGEPYESWLFRRRGELAMLYQGLRRDSTGSVVHLQSLRPRAGYFTCLLAAPHRSPI